MPVCVRAVASGPTAGPAIYKTLEAQDVDSQKLVVHSAILLLYDPVVGPSNTQHIWCVVLRCIHTIGRKGQAGKGES